MSLVAEWLKERWRWLVVGVASGLFGFLVTLTVDSCRQYRIDKHRADASDAGVAAVQAEGDASGKQVLIPILTGAADAHAMAAQQEKQRMVALSDEYERLREAKVELDAALEYLWKDL